MKKRNGACPICYARSLVTPKEKKIPTLYNQTPFENGLAKTPPLGWNSWNTLYKVSPFPLFLPKGFGGLPGTLAGYSPWSCKELDTTEHGCTL